MSSALNHAFDLSKKGKVLKSAYDSETFDADGTIHVDGLVGSATISPSGRDIALASPEGLAIIDLDSPYNPPRRLSSHGSPWLVVDVQWSPFAARDYWVASTANHRCLVWNLNLREDSATGAIEHSLQGHSRAITDINFSAHHPDILATCAVDGYVHCWDLRKPRQPVLTFCDWLAGATQVKYNRQDPNILASSHDRWLHIWDERKPSMPLKSISAHTSKIYGLDWNRTSSTSLVTCSLDKSMKFWDYETSDEPERIIQADFPVWRARYSPFGWGLLAMPQNDHGHLYLYDTRLGEDDPRDGPVHPVKMFPGPPNYKAKEFLWRSRGGITDDGIDNREFQLVSWGEDNELRLHRVDPEILESVGHIKGGPAQKKYNVTRKGAVYKTFRTVDDGTNSQRRMATMSDPRPDSRGGQYRRNLHLSAMSSSYSRPGTSQAWRGPSMKAKSATGKPNDRNRDQLGWMKGITMSRKKSGVLGTPPRKESKDLSLFGPGFHDNHWGEPETLQEEIIRVNQQLPNVHWDNVDMDKLTLKASLEGPWGVDGNTIYIKVNVDIPHNYPKSKPPKFLIEKQALMSDKTFKKLDREVQQLAAQFSKRKQNCLEVIFSYFLGETDLSSSDSFFKNVKDLDDDLDGLADESSSEDEDDIPAGGSITMSQELMTASTELDATLAPANRLAIPPDPCRCGARFSNDGKLICFFPSKEERARSLFSPSDSYKDRSKDEPTFAGFGRLQADSTPPRRRYTNDETSATDDQSDSDESSSSTSSSDSETTYMHKINMWYLPGRRFRKTFSGTLSLHSSGGGTGIGTGTGTGTSRRRPAKPKNIVSIHNFARELPSQQEFAHEYCIFGDGAEVCEHNAKVAEKYGRPDLIDVWRYAALLLRKDIPLELFDHDHHPHKSVLVIAKDAVARSREERFDIDNLVSSTITGRVKWGEHPLAKGLVRDLFDYFEKIADIQMLAMLSCVFSESTTGDSSTAYAESHLSQPETPLAMKAPAFSLDYFPTDASSWHPTSKPHYNSVVSTPKTAHTPVHIPGSYGSDGGAWEGEPGSNSYSCGETPPSRTPHEHLSDGDPTQSLSTSPNNKLLHRASTALSSASGFAASFPRPFSHVASTSPPGRKRPSPGEGFLNNLAPSNITWGGSTILGPTSEPSATARNSLSDDEARRDNRLPLVCYGISAEVEDQSIFDDDGWLATPLLEPSRDAIYASYRHAYAEMLQMWGQPLARLEIMKFNVLKQDPAGNTLDPFGMWSAKGDSYHDSYNSPDSTRSHTSQSYHAGPSQIVLGKKEQLQAVIHSNRGIDVTGICRVHETHLEPMQSTHPSAKVGGAVGTCERCKRTQTQLICVYCREPIDALYAPCLTCGCATHDACLAEWYAAGETECPAGDECRCIESASEGQIETFAVMMGALRQGKIRKPSGSISIDGSDVATIKKTLKMVADEEKKSSNHHNDWEKVVGGEDQPSTDGRPLERSQSHVPLSAAKFSLGTRLRKSAGQWGSTTSLRNNNSNNKKPTVGSSALGRG